MMVMVTLMVMMMMDGGDDDDGDSDGDVDDDGWVVMMMVVIVMVTLMVMMLMMVTLMVMMMVMMDGGDDDDGGDVDEHVDTVDAPVFEAKEEDKVDDKSASNKCTHSHAKSKRNSFRLRRMRKPHSVAICDDTDCPFYHEPPSRDRSNKTTKQCVIQ
ncbi:hypothetical protein QZH41_012254 [Actinostola sp. cb2023]|nr:hypothetical protein QZH41_012254 [Actinostola sp. cb2023]